MHAIPAVTGELKRWFRDQGWWIRPPRRLQELRARALVEEERLRNALRREADDDAIATALGCCPLEVGAATAPGGSLADEPNGARCPEGDIAARDAFDRAICALTDEQRLILRLQSTALGPTLARGERSSA